MHVDRPLFLFKKYFLASRVILTISLLIFQANHAHAFQQREQIEFERFSPENGLASSEVWAVIQDYKGLIWISTENGLNQYDGYNFKLYEHNHNDPNSLGYNYVFNLIEDRDQHLWICTLGGGLNLYNRKLDNFYTFMHNENDSNSISGNRIRTIFQDRKGIYWIGTVGQGVCTFKFQKGQDPTKIQFKRISAIDNFYKANKLLTVSSITEDQHENIWIGTDNKGIFLIHPDGNYSQLVHDPTNSNSLASDKIYDLFCDSRHRIWISTWDAGLDLFDPESNTFIHYTASNNLSSICNNQVWVTRESKNGEIWIGTDTGLNRFEDASKQIPDNEFKRYTHNDDDDKSLKSDIIQGLYFDHQDRMWLSTTYGGLNLWDKNKLKFYPIRSEKGNPRSLSNNNVTDFVEDTQGNIWIGTDGGGLNVFNKLSGSIYDNKYSKYRYDAQNPNSLIGDKILCLSMDSKGGIWIGTWAAGLAYLNTNTNEHTHFKYNSTDSNSVSSNEIFSIEVDKQDNLWIGTYKSGLNYYNIQTQNFMRFVHDPDDAHSIGSDNISSIVVDEDNNLWIGTDGGGLNYFDWKTETFTRYLNPDTTDSRQFANCLYRDSKDLLWASFYGYGVVYLNEESDQLKKIEGLNVRNLVVNGILDDGENLWLGTIKGLISYNLNNKKTLHFDYTDGLQGNQFLRTSAYKTSDGILLFGGNNGFNAIDPQDIKFNTVPPPIIFTDITINDQMVSYGPESPLKQHISETTQMTLNYAQNSFSISFAALDYTMPEKNQYKYILEGFQDDWIPLHDERKVVFTSLDPDTYTLRVKASNNDGVWNEQGASLTITILPPWWATLWFRFIIVAAIVFGGFAAIKLRTRYLVRQRIELKRIIAARTEEINDINSQLEEKLEEISHQNTVLSEQKNEIYSQNNQLEAFNEELTAQNEQVFSQNEKIQAQNKTLEEYQLQITGVNENLEKKVKARTKKLKETINELNKTVVELDRFVYSASHDLSSPLKSILGLVHIANLENKSERIDEYLKYIESSIKKLEVVINNLVQFSRNNRIKVKFEEIILHSLVTEVIKELRFMPEAESITFNIDIPEDHFVSSDTQRLKIVLHNLIGNAIKYGDPEKSENKIIIKFLHVKNGWQLNIKDNGIGIEKDNLKNIFNMFFRATEKSSGSGLGLFIVKETIEKLKGEIHVTSTPGIGSSFTLAFNH